MPFLRQAAPSLKRVVLVSFLIDASDIILNLVVSLISGSVVMLSQALQGVADLTTSGILLYGVNRSQRRANKQFQFGYGRELFFWVLVAAVSMFLITGVSSIWIGINRFNHPETIHNIGLSLIVLGIGLISNLYAFSLSFRRLYHHTQRRSLSHLLRGSMVETKTTLFLDGLGSVAAMFGIVSLVALILTGDHRLDGVGAILTGLATASLAIFIIRDARSLLVGRSASQADTDAIKEAALSVPGVIAIEDLRTMFMGSARLLVNIEVNLSPHLHTRKIENIIDEIKLEVKKRVPRVAHIQVELESH